MFRKKQNKLKIAIIGIAVKHSMSPVVHKTFGRQCGVQVFPKLVEIKNNEEAFFLAMRDLAKQGYHGVTVAQPFKELAFLRLCHKVTDRAKYAGAVNTIRITFNGKFIGENTDGFGLVNDIKKNFGFMIKGKRVLLLGAGGAACGVIKPLLDEQPKELVIVNRTIVKAKILAGKFSDLSLSSVSAVSFDELQGCFDLIINATSASMQKKLPGKLHSKLISEKSLCYDLYYQRKGLTAFEEWAWNLGARPANGVGMVVEQGAIAFNHWCNKDQCLNTKKLIVKIPFHRSVDAMTANLLFSKSSSEIMLINKCLKNIQSYEAKKQHEHDKKYGLVLLENEKPSIISILQNM